ncbi:protein YmiD, partial [Shigella boydii]
ANYHLGIRYIMTGYSAKYIYSSTYARFR